MASKYTKEKLSKLNNVELREICKKKKIPGMSKKRKDVMVDAILLAHGGTKANAKSSKKAKTLGIGKDGEPTKNASEAKKDDKLQAATFTLSSVLTKPSAKYGDRTTTTIRVSSGAAAGDFPVTGRTVSSVKSFLSEVLNISKMSSPIVNGKQVEDNYVIKQGDELEFLKPAGQKG